MVISQGDVVWASLDDPAGSGPGFSQPVMIVQGDSFNASRIATTVVVPLTSNLRLAAAPGNVVLAAARTGLPKDSVANVSQLLSIDRRHLGPGGDGRADDGLGGVEEVVQLGGGDVVVVLHGYTMLL